MSKTKLMLGDNIESLKKLPENSVDSIVSDPPYGLSFMGKKWDYDVPSVDFWKEVYRVLKPGGHVLSFGGTRTYHRMVVNIEDAGFEIRDQIMWLYGSGFPKSHNIGKAVDKIQGNDREVVGEKLTGMARHKTTNTTKNEKFNGGQMMIEDTKGQSPYEGWGTALKPANEPICVARKPLSEKSVAENVLKWGTGGINVDGCRVGSDSIKTMPKKDGDLGASGIYNEYKEYEGNTHEGRFPANIILECICDEVIKGETIDKRRMMGSANGGNDDGRYNWNNGDKNDFKSVRGHKDTLETHTNPMCPCYLMDEQSGLSKSSPNKWEGDNNAAIYGKYEKGIRQSTFSDKGGASRFFFKASYNFLEEKEYKMKNKCQQNNYKLVQYVEQNGLNISQITELIAQTNVEEKVKNKLALLVKSALNLSEKCSMYIVANIVAIATDNMASPLTQDFITELENYILIQNLAQIVEVMDNTDTTPTTQSLMKLFGSALLVIEKHTQLDQEQEKEERKSEQLTSTYRFKYQAKVSKAERNMGLDEFEEKVIEGRDAGQDERAVAYKKRPTPTKNTHPTVKPVSLMAYLCRLITPAGGIVLDPFMGSGSTGIAARLEGFKFLGMELDKDYFKIAESRIENFEEYRKFVRPNENFKNGNTRMASRNSNSISLGLGITKPKK